MVANPRSPLQGGNRKWRSQGWKEVKGARAVWRAGETEFKGCQAQERSVAGKQRGEGLRSRQRHNKQDGTGEANERFNGAHLSARPSG